MCVCVCVVMPYVAVCCNKTHSEKNSKTNERASAKIRKNVHICCVCGTQLWMAKRARVSLTHSGTHTHTHWSKQSGRQAALSLAKLSHCATGPAALLLLLTEAEAESVRVASSSLLFASPRFVVVFVAVCRCRRCRCRRSRCFGFVALRIPISCQFASN